MKLLLGIVGLIGLGYLGFSGAFERSLVYPFDPTRVSPQDANAPRLKEVLFESAGETLVLWVAKPKDGKPTILYFHGNAGNLANRAHRFNSFLDHGFGVVAMAYRGSSGSTGVPSQKAIMKDAIIVYMGISKLVESDLVIFYGESLGTGVAILVAASKAVSENFPLAIVLESPFTSIPDVARHAYPRIGGAAVVFSNKWPTKNWIGKLDIPLLILHGTQDDLIPIQMGRKVFEMSGAADKTFFAVKGAGHNNVWQPDTKAALYRFLNRF